VILIQKFDMTTRFLSLKEITLIMQELLIPKEAYEAVWDINLEFLKEQQITTLILDLDNTLLSNKQRNLSIQHLNWLQKCKDNGFQIYLLSNNRSKKRVSRAASQIECNGFYLAMKPFTFSIKHLADTYNLNLKQCAIIGDQVFKDVILGNWLNVYSILVEPIDKTMSIFTRAQYTLERYLTKKLK
tara:strand:+ start:2163 stop:2720 length:558 start_codon:yes stop_codon:yes gene_type:complete